MERGVEHFDALVRLEGSGWKERGGTAIASSPQTRAFYEEVARWAAERGMLRLAFLDVGSTPIAADLMLEDRGAWHTLKRGYDERYRAHAPGKLILEDLLRAACEGPIERLELLGSQDPYKLEWTDRVRERVLLQAFAPTPAGQTERVAQRFGRPLAKRALALLHL
jgi:CelD/BcsL family acetyltransferase involved in cellulose biosynthesis